VSDVQAIVEDALSRLGIACPTCLNEDLTPGSDPRLPRFLRCTRCGAVYPIEHETPHLVDVRVLLQLPSELLAVWDLTQERARPLYASNDPLNCSVQERDDVRAFRRFMKLAGKEVLDIGSGSFAPPGYLQGGDGGIDGRGVARFVGLDPIPPSAAPDFPLVVAFGERLPFPDDSFDVVIAATSLDHALDVETVLSEVRRTLRPAGEFYCWVGLLEDEAILGPEVLTPTFPRELDEPARQASVDSYFAAREEYKRRVGEAHEHPEVAEDATVDIYHFRHFNRRRLHAALTRGEFWVEDEQIHVGPSGEIHAFTRAVKASPEQRATQVLLDRVRDEFAFAVRPLKRLESELHAAREELAEIRAMQELFHAMWRNRGGRRFARKVKHRIRKSRATD
jgi:SAM-dependent methyltransferase/uncharacterized protein YbaR (Trm112 family)